MKAYTLVRRREIDCHDEIFYSEEEENEMFDDIYFNLTLMKSKLLKTM